MTLPTDWHRSIVYCYFDSYCSIDMFGDENSRNSDYGEAESKSEASTSRYCFAVEGLNDREFDFSLLMLPDRVRWAEHVYSICSADRQTCWISLLA